MLHTISTELLILKKKNLLSLCIVIPILYLLCYLYAGSKIGVDVIFLDFRFLMIDSYLPVLLLHSLAIGIFGFSLFGIALKTDTHNRLDRYPVSMLRYFFAKICTIFIFSVFIMLTAAAELTILGLIISNTGFTMSNIIFTFTFYLLIAITLPLGLMPIFFLMAICRRNPLIPIVSLFLYLSLTFLPGFGIIHINGNIAENIFKYLYPFGSAAMIQKDCLYKRMPAELLGFTESNTYIPLCILCLLAFTVFFAVLSTTSLKKQTL